MKIDTTHLVSICLTLTLVISPVAVNADAKTVIKTNSASNITTNKHEILNKHQISLNKKAVHPGKSSLTDDSRGLSAFFIFGIAINIIMAITFGWWFSKEWRKSKVKGDDK